MNKKTFFGVVTVLIMASCHQTSSNVPESTIAINVRNGSNPIEIQLPEIVDSVHYLALQTSDDCLLGFIQDVRRDSNFYVVKDGHELFAFNEKGEFLNRIGRRGSGPGEYINFDAFYLDRVKNLVYIVSNYQKEILCYSYSGAYCFSIELPHDDGISSVTLCETGEWLAYHRLLNSDTDDIPQYSVMQDMKNGSLVTTPLLPAIGIMARNSFISAQGRPIAHFQGQYYLISAFSNKIYEYENGQISSVYYVDSPNIAPSQSFLEEYKGCELYDFYKILGEKKIGFGLMDVDASSECLFFTVGARGTLIWDKKNAVLIEGIVNEELNTFLLSGLPSLGGISDEHLAHYSAETICNLRDKLEKGDNPELKKIVQTLKGDDNPIVVQYFFKKNLVDSLIAKYKL